LSIYIEAVEDIKMKKYLMNEQNPNQVEEQFQSKLKNAEGVDRWISHFGGNFKHLTNFLSSSDTIDGNYDFVM